MLLAAFPYFETRFYTSGWIMLHFTSAITSVSTVTGLVFMLLLAHRQRNASYSNRVIVSLIVSSCLFMILALSTTIFTSVSAEAYFAFLMFVVFGTSSATSFCQNGLFAYVSKLGVSEHTQAIMMGNAIAGVLPCIARIVTVLLADEAGTVEKKTSVFAYFQTATGVSILALGAFLLLLNRQKFKDRAVISGADDADEAERPERKVLGLLTLFSKLRWLSLAMIICFGATMLFPVFTPQIYSVQPLATAPRLFHPDSFIPLAFLAWNTGDLVGRILILIPSLVLTRYPRLLFFMSIFRCAFIPLYLVCNVHNRGALINSDFFYLFFVQFLFGVSNGYIGSSCMVAAAQWVEADEREAAGAFMGLMLVVGLACGSLLSFTAAL